MSTWAGLRRQEKGKMRARDEGSGGPDGIVLPMDVVASGVYDVAYTIPILVGSSQQNLSVQVDTGSSDLWIASNSCSTSACKQTNGHLYDPTGATQTGVEFNITYLDGDAAGPIVWDTVQIGGYSIQNQALAAADQVSNEPLASNYDGILGLALPLNSKISQSIPPVTGNSPDGAAFASNLFGITPVSSAPAARFISISLSRPGSDAVPALLGIGRHPEQLVSDPSKILYSSLVAESVGTLFWKINVRAITVYVNSVAMPVEIGRSNDGQVYPTAVLDSGVPLILTTSTIANGIYGALGIGPSADGQYYVPCDTPLNMTFTLDERPEIPIHPLDLTVYPTQGPSQYCIGLIQPADAQLATPNSGIGDMILGVPFLRNTYTVMAYKPPDADGNFSSNATSASSSSSGVDNSIQPRLGLLSLTNPTTALSEFNRVRVLNQPLTPGSSPSNGSNSIVASGRKMSVGIEVLIGLLAFFALCFALFALRFFLGKRQWSRRNNAALRDEFDGQTKGADAFGLARRGSGRDAGGDHMPTEDTLRTLRYEEYMKKERIHSNYTVSTGRTWVNEGEEAGEDGVLRSRKLSRYDSNEARVVRPVVSAAYTDADAWDPHTSLGWGDVPIPGVQPDSGTHAPVGFSPGQYLSDDDGDDSSPERQRLTHARTASELNPAGPVHNRGPSVSAPLLAHAPGDTPPMDNRIEDLDLGEFGMGMAGVGTAARGSKIDSALRHSRVVSTGSAGSGSPIQSRFSQADVTETPVNNHVGGPERPSHQFEERGLAS